MSVQTFDPNEPVHVTAKARQHFVDQLKHQEAAQGVMLSVKESGCSGYQYVIEYTQQPPPKDVSPISLEDSFYLYVDPQASTILNGTTIDLVQEGLNESIEFQNPNVQSRCGCGESFSIDT